MTLTIETDNAAFEGEENLTAEVARLLRKVAQQIEGGQSFGKIIDSNGNTVGKFSL